MPTYEQLLESYSKEFQPKTQEQTDLVETLARSKWNLQRLRKLEDGIWQTMFHSDDGADPVQAFMSDCVGAKVYDKLQRYISNIQRNYDRAMRQLKKTAPKTDEHGIPKDVQVDLLLRNLGQAVEPTAAP